MGSTFSWDQDGIASGDFERVILANIRDRAHFLALLSPLGVEGCRNRDDWLRREVEAALASHRNIIPIRLDGFDFDDPAHIAELTGSIAALRNYNALEVPVNRFLDTMRHLREEFLHVSVGTVLHPASTGAAEIASDEAAANTAAVPARRREQTASNQPSRQDFFLESTLVNSPTTAKTSEHWINRRTRLNLPHRKTNETSPGVSRN